MSWPHMWPTGTSLALMVTDRDFARVVEAGRLGDGQRIHVGAQHDRRAGAIAQQADHTGLPNCRRDVVSRFAELLRCQTCSSCLLHRKLGMGMNVLVQGFEIRNERIDVREYGVRVRRSYVSRVLVLILGCHADMPVEKLDPEWRTGCQNPGTFHASWFGACGSYSDGWFLVCLRDFRSVERTSTLGNSDKQSALWRARIRWRESHHAFTALAQQQTSRLIRLHSLSRTYQL